MRNFWTIRVSRGFLTLLEEQTYWKIRALHEYFAHLIQCFLAFLFSFNSALHRFYHKHYELNWRHMRIPHYSFLIGIQCPTLSAPEHGRMTPEVCRQGPMASGTTCRFKCTSGYNLLGRATLRCNKKGVWSNRAPICSRGEIKSRRFHVVSNVSERSYTK